MGPTCDLTVCTNSFFRIDSSTCTPLLRTTKPNGISPFNLSSTPITAHSATTGCVASASSSAPVDNRWPATLITSSIRLITQR